MFKDFGASWPGAGSKLVRAAYLFVTRHLEDRARTNPLGFYPTGKRGVGGKEREIYLLELCHNMASLAPRVLQEVTSFPPSSCVRLKSVLVVWTP